MGKACTVAWLLSVVGEEGRGGFHQQAVTSPSQTDPNVMHPKLPGSIFVVRLVPPALFFFLLWHRQ